MEVVMRIKEFIVEKTGDAWTININGKTYEASGVSINLIDVFGDVHLFGLDNPMKFELYENIRKLHWEREPDGSMYVELYIMGY
jgi:hypothetical protein